MKLSKENIENIYPCTPMQEGIFSSWQINPESASYLLQTQFIVKGEVDVLLFEKAFRQITARYEILRTVFKQVAGHSALQIVMKESHCDFKFHDVLERGSLSDILADDLSQVFDLTKVTPFRLNLVRLEKNRYSIVWTHHYILMEGWCFFLLMKDFLGMYHKLSANIKQDETNTPKFSSYIKWLKTQDKEASKTYWDRYLADFRNKEIRFPKVQNKINPAYHFTMKELKIGPANQKKLQKLCSDWGCTLNQFTGVLWAILLFQYNGCRDIAMVWSFRYVPRCYKALKR